MRSKIAPEDSVWRNLAKTLDPKAVRLATIGNWMNGRRDSCREELDAQISRQRRAIALARTILPLRDHPLFQEYHKSLQGMRDAATKDLITTTSSNDYMRVLQGQVQAYEKILRVMDRQEAEAKALEQGLSVLENDRKNLDPSQAEATR